MKLNLMEKLGIELTSPETMMPSMIIDKEELAVTAVLIDRAITWSKTEEGSEYWESLYFDLCRNSIEVMGARKNVRETDTSYLLAALATSMQKSGACKVLGLSRYEDAMMRIARLRVQGR